jgi:hypothetical protein
MRIEYMPKRGGARLKEVNSYKIQCEKKEKTVVVKVHLEGSLPAARELLAISILQGTKFEQNTVRHVCDFVCMDDRKEEVINCIFLSWNIFATVM